MNEILRGRDLGGGSVSENMRKVEGSHKCKNLFGIKFMARCHDMTHAPGRSRLRTMQLGICGVFLVGRRPACVYVDQTS
jgi:hypothetical protein